MRQLRYGLEQERANLAEVRVRVAIAGRDDRTGGTAKWIVRGRQVVVAVVRTDGIVAMRRAMNGVESVVMTAIGREQVQTLAQHDNAGVGGR